MQREAELLGRIERLERELLAARMELGELQKQRSEVQKCEVKKILEERVALFAKRFVGRTDVYAKRFESLKTGKSGYQPVCANLWKRGICNKPKLKCNQCQYRVWEPLTEKVLERHLRGELTVGIYPLLQNDTCHFLVVDFDDGEAARDAQVFVDTCARHHLPVALERSRSGEGYHVWFFFSEPIEAWIARRMGSLLLTETMEQHPEIGFKSYDRLFPSQDRLPSAEYSLGNLIALPLQHLPRTKGNSVFVRPHTLAPYPDQWEFLAGIETISRQTVQSISRLEENVFNLESDEAKPWSRHKKVDLSAHVKQPLSIALADKVYFKLQELSPPLHTALLRLAAFENPEFHKAQAMRLPVHTHPRIICCAHYAGDYLALPRGCIEKAVQLLNEAKISFTIADRRNAAPPLGLTFHGTLRPKQESVVSEILEKDLYVLAAPTAFGKTVTALAIIAQRDAPTLILTHRSPLLEQWRSQCISFLGLTKKEIGRYAGATKRLKGKVDLASLQTLARMDDDKLRELLAPYVHIVVDECHHISAVSFERVLSFCRARYVLGLSATPYRQDGHHPIIFMQCGFNCCRPQERVDEQLASRTVIVRETQTQLPSFANPCFNDLAQVIVADATRTQLILNDLRQALADGRTPIVVTERKEHLEHLADAIRQWDCTFEILVGGMSPKKQRAALERFRNASSPRLLLATGKLLGEGFDEPSLDTLFLTFPISWHGSIAQYVGRLHRHYEGKKDLQVYDYLDLQIPMLRQMFARRKKGYTALNYTLINPATDLLLTP